MNTGEKIKKIRKMAGMTQEELAEKMNVSRQTISKWEKGLSSPDLESALVLCGLFRLSLDDFLKEGPTEKNEEKISLQDLIRINRRNQKLTILLISGLFSLMTGMLAAFFIAALDSTITSLEYMLYRYIAAGQYAYAPIDYQRLDLLVLLLILTGVLLLCAYAAESRKEKKRNGSMPAAPHIPEQTENRKEKKPDE